MTAITKQTIYPDTARKELSRRAIPRHIAIIPDGNRRWASKHLLQAAQGHDRGVRVVRQVIEAAKELGIRILTIYSFSTENWRRPKYEVDTLMELLKRFLLEERAKMVKGGIRLKSIGDPSGLPEDLRRIFFEIEEETEEGEALDLVLALNYGGRDEIRRMARKIALGVKRGLLEEDSITETLIGSLLDTAEWPDPDLLIRTSGEFRLSNFLLWQSSYTEFFTTEKFWPEFTPEDFLLAIKTYQERKQRKGA